MFYEKTAYAQSRFGARLTRKVLAAAVHGIFAYKGSIVSKIIAGQKKLVWVGLGYNKKELGKGFL